MSTLTAQHGEDVWLERYFGGRLGTFAEVGAFDGVHLSNTLHLESLGWRGVLVEPDPENAAKCRHSRPLASVAECAAVSPENVGRIAFHRVRSDQTLSTVEITEGQRVRFREEGLQVEEISVLAKTLDSILIDAGCRSLDFLSIDVEGSEHDVLEGFTIARWRPQIVMVESSTGRRSPAVRRYFTSQGYAFLHRIVCNDIYAPVWIAPRLAPIIDVMKYVTSKVAARVRSEWSRRALRA